MTELFYKWTHHLYHVERKWVFAELALTLLIKSYGEEAGHNFWQVYELKRKVFGTFCYMTACHQHACVHVCAHMYTQIFQHTAIFPNTSPITTEDELTTSDCYFFLTKKIEAWLSTLSEGHRIYPNMKNWDRSQLLEKLFKYVKVNTDNSQFLPVMSYFVYRPAESFLRSTSHLTEH